MLKRSILDNLWQSGFCKDLIEQLRNTLPGPAGSAVRIEITTAHIQAGCVDCLHANTLRDVEHRTALTMGDAAIQLFNRGGDIRHLPGFRDAFRRVFDAGVRVGKIDKAVSAWLTRVVEERAGKPYPYAEEDNGSQTN